MENAAVASGMAGPSAPAPAPAQAESTETFRELWRVALEAEDDTVAKGLVNKYLTTDPQQLEPCIDALLEEQAAHPEQYNARRALISPLVKHVARWVLFCVKGKPAKERWERRDATFPARGDVEDFLRSGERTLELRGFQGVGAARAFVKAHEAECAAFNLVMKPGGRGEDASVEIVKRRWRNGTGLGVGEPFQARGPVPVADAGEGSGNGNASSSVGAGAGGGRPNPTTSFYKRRKLQRKKLPKLKRLLTPTDWSTVQSQAFRTQAQLFFCPDGYSNGRGGLSGGRKAKRRRGRGDDDENSDEEEDDYSDAESVASIESEPRSPRRKKQKKNKTGGGGAASSTSNTPSASTSAAQNGAGQGQGQGQGKKKSKKAKAAANAPSARTIRALQRAGELAPSAGGAGASAGAGAGKEKNRNKNKNQ
ncbi:hypothetical protein OC842_006860 [Tilletia horrida]|uniref:Uncharacterized protein n=1 Tax=Tilletia horrida TaxID=155126 RepID=A0AAN6G4R1_9BASI|nr:hypothetical protein OC842_006860 [Tilletia horrida]